MANHLAIGVDLGATKIASALVTRQGQVLASRQVPTSPGCGTAFVLEKIAAEVNILAQQASAPVDGVGIASPGLVLPSEGIVRNALNLGWSETPLVRGVRSHLEKDLPIWIEKDTNASALGEWYFGAARGCSDFVYVSVGSGLGGGIIANGQLIPGAGLKSAELGHFSLDPNGRRCACGLRGCAETIVSGPGLLAVMRELLERGLYATNLDRSAELSTGQVVAAAREGDRLARAAFELLGNTLGIVMAACVAILNPALFVVGGGLGLAAFDLFLSAVREELSRRSVPAAIDHLQIVPSSLTSSAVGASCLVWNSRDGSARY